MDTNLKNINLQAILANKYLQIGSIIFIIVNIIILNVFVFIASRQTSSTSIASDQQKTPTINQRPTTNSQQLSTCTTCEAQLTDILARIQKIETVLSVTPIPPIANPSPTPLPPTTAPTATTIPTPTPTRIIGTPTPTVTVSGVKEYYILLGSGNSSSSEWADISGLQATINTSLYPTIKTATLELTGNTPTGNETIWVRLYNATDNYPVPNSEITWNGGGDKIIVSNPITLTTGNKTYKVQMKTQLSFVSNVNNAKIHLILY